MYACAVFSKDGDGVVIRNFIDGRMVERIDVIGTNNRAEILKFLERTKPDSFTVSEYQQGEHTSKEYTVWYSITDKLKPATEWKDL
jgi:hypothetical protein